MYVVNRISFWERSWRTFTFALTRMLLQPTKKDQSCRLPMQDERRLYILSSVCLPLLCFQSCWSHMQQQWPLAETVAIDSKSWRDNPSLVPSDIPAVVYQMFHRIFQACTIGYPEFRALWDPTLCALSNASSETCQLFCLCSVASRDMHGVIFTVDE